MNKPILIVIAGPNGSGKTTITHKVILHDINAARVTKRFIEGGHGVPIDKIVSRYRKAIWNIDTVSGFADRVYFYDNSVEDEEAQLLFRTVSGKLYKEYIAAMPQWVQPIYAKIKAV